jgi:predicted amidohydrolase YtcJ
VLGGIQCAVTRCDLNGVGPYLPHEAFTVQEALDSFTKNAAWASFEEDRKGQIVPGMLADFTVLGGNPFETDPACIKDIPVLKTFSGGREVYSR